MDFWQPPRVPFVFLRHGETDWNREGRLQGRRDLPLNRVGRAQASRAGLRLRDLELCAVFHSPLERAEDTARLVAGARGVPLHSVAELAECSFGELEGQVADQMRPGWRSAWMAGQSIPGAEAYADFLSRAELALDAVLRQSSGAAAPPLVVAHGGIYWALQRALDTGFDGDLPNCVPVLHRPLGRCDWSVTAFEP